MGGREVGRACDAETVDGVEKRFPLLQNGLGCGEMGLPVMLALEKMQHPPRDQRGRQQGQQQDHFQSPGVIGCYGVNVLHA